MQDNDENSTDLCAHCGRMMQASFEFSAGAAIAMLVLCFGAAAFLILVFS